MRSSARGCFRAGTAKRHRHPLLTPLSASITRVSVSFSVSLQKKYLCVARDPSQQSLMARRGHAALVTMVAMVVVAGMRAESSVEALKNKQLYSDAMYGDSAAVADLLARGAKPDGYAYEVSQKM